LQVGDVETIANAGTLTITHNFNYVPTVNAVKDDTGWVQAVNGTDYTAVTNAALTETVFTNVSGGELDFIINVT